MLSTLSFNSRNRTVNFRGRWLTTAACATLAVATSLPAYADDTEVFFGQVNDNTSIHPNVLFVLDTSGSMLWGDAGQEGSRLDRMKDAMETILDDATNVNVGLMRMNGLEGGGAVIYPITPINELVCGPGDSCGMTTVNSRVRHSTDDSEQYSEPGDPKANNTGGFILGMGEESSSGKKQIVGHRFRKVMVPQGADITSARIIFTAAGNSSGDAELKIYGEDVDNAAKFKNDDDHLGSRFDNATSAHIDWDAGNWSQSQTYESPDVTDIIQEIVNRDNWCGGNHMSMFVTGEGTRPAFSYDAGSNVGAKLVVTYDGDSIPSNGGCIEKTLTVQVSADIDDAQELIYPGSYTYNEKMYRYLDDIRMPRNSTDGFKFVTGFHFSDLPIPQGADVKRADLQLVTSDAMSGDATVEIGLENSTNPNQIRSNRGDLSDRSLLSEKKNWELPDADDMPAGTKIRSGNFRDMVEDLVGNSGWDPENNGMLFVLKYKSGNGTRWFKSYDQEPSAAAKLRITYRENIGETRLTAKDELKEVVANLSATGGTPIAGAYLEAANYYLGNEVDYGRTRGSDNALWYGNYYDERHHYHRVSHPESYNGVDATRHLNCTNDYLNSSYCKSEEIVGDAVYKSALASSCQSNHIVFLSDGDPTSNTAASKIRTLTGNDTCEGTGQEECATELAAWLNETDHVASLANNQSVTTYTIGFNLESDFLEEIAAAGGGRYFQAASANELTRVFDDILSDVLSVDTSFVAPGATVNQFNRLTHDKNIYFALFQPNKRPTWEGNIKRYQVLTEDGETNIYDQNLINAVDEESGFFKVQSQSLWTEGDNNPDGHAIEAGGAAEHITLNYAYETNESDNILRRAYTFTGDASALHGNSSTADLTAEAHQLNENNDLITTGSEMLNIQNVGSDDAARNVFRENILKWARGVDVLDENQNGNTTEARRHMGDPMHSRPVIVNYEREATVGATQAGEGESGEVAIDEPALTTIYVSTNEGYLHAIDQDTGKELYSFMPQELLKNLYPNFENVTTASRPYGLDGAISVITNDANGNVIVDGEEKAYLYVGMRRGGRNIYALDITDRHVPKLAWVIKGGEDGTPGFTNMGETWSRLVPHKIFHEGEVKKVLTFTAGYDTNQDPKDGDPLRTTDDIGRGLFMVDAETGAKIWSGGGISGDYDQHFSQMTYSIPSTPRVIDVDADGFSDQIWVGDMGGQLWRFDLAKYHVQGDFVKGGVMASLSGTGTPNERRFYSEPDVAIVAYQGQRYLTVGIGSGWRAHPLDDAINDRYYMLRTKDVYRAPADYGKYVESTDSYTPLVEADLHNTTDHLANSANPYGWYINLERNGEKVMGASTTLNNKVLFTSYVPESAIHDCSPAVGDAYLYAVSVFGGLPVRKFQLDDGTFEETNKDHRSTKLKRGGIPPEATVLLVGDADTRTNTDDEGEDEDGSTDGYTDGGTTDGNDDDTTGGHYGGGGDDDENDDGGSNTLILVGTEKQDIDVGLGTERTFWLDKSKAGRSHAESAFDD